MTTTYTGRQQLQWLLNNHPTSVVPTYGVNLDPGPGESSCQCHRCKPGDTSAGKHPVMPWKDLPNGYHPNVIATYAKSWAEDASSVGWALVTGRAGLVVVDCDPRHGGNHAYAELVAKYGPLPLTAHDRTGGGGWHRYFIAPNFVGAVGKSALQLAPGVELLSGNHLVQVPPSVHYTGRSYEWVDAPWDVGFAELPAWLSDKLRDHLRPAYGADDLHRLAAIRREYGNEENVRRARDYLSKVPVAVSGQGGWAHTNATVLKIVRGFSLNDEDAYAILADWNAACSPPWSPQQLRAKIQWARHQAANAPDGFILDRNRKPAKASKPIKITFGKRAQQPAIEQPASIDRPAVIEPCKHCGDLVCGRLCQSRQLFDTDEITGGVTNRVKGYWHDSPTERHRQYMASRPAVQPPVDDFACHFPKSIVGKEQYQGSDRVNIVRILPRCKKWSCPGCGRLHKAEHSENIRRHIKPEHTVYYREVEIEQRETIAKQIRRIEVTIAKGTIAVSPPVPQDCLGKNLYEIRRAGDYFGVALPNGKLGMYSNANFKDSTAIPGKQAVEEITGIINEHGRKGIVQPSRNWMRPPREKLGVDFTVLAVVEGHALGDEATHARVETEGVRIEPVQVSRSNRHAVLDKWAIDVTDKSAGKIHQIVEKAIAVPSFRIKVIRVGGREFRPETELSDLGVLIPSFPQGRTTEFASDELFTRGEIPF